MKSRLAIFIEIVITIILVISAASFILKNLKRNDPNPCAVTACPSEPRPREGITPIPDPCITHPGIDGCGKG